MIYVLLDAYGKCVTCYPDDNVSVSVLVNASHIEGKRKNVHRMCGKKHVIQIMIWFCQSKLF